MKKSRVCAVMLSLIMVFGIFAPMTVTAADNDGYIYDPVQEAEEELGNDLTDFYDFYDFTDFDDSDDLTDDDDSDDDDFTDLDDLEITDDSGLLETFGLPLSGNLDIIQVTLISAIDGNPFIAQFDPATGRITSFFSNGYEEYRYVDSEEAFWELVEINAQVTGQVFNPYTGEINAVEGFRGGLDRNIVIIDFESRTRVEYDAHGNRTETILGDEFYDYFQFAEYESFEHEFFEHEFFEHGLLERDPSERDAYYEEPITASNSGIRSVSIPRASSPENGPLVGGQFFTPATAHKFVVLRVIDLPWSLSGVDVFFTNSFGDDKAIVWNVPRAVEARYAFRFPRQAYGARVASRVGSGTATLLFFSGSPVTISLNSNGGSVNPSRIDAFPGSPISTLPTPTRFNRYFVGWFNTGGPTGGTRFTAASIAPNSNMSLTARWNDPSRHRHIWWPAANSGTTQIPFRIQPGLASVWMTAINNGIRNWNNLSHRTRVSFQSNPSSNNLVKVSNSTNVELTTLGLFEAYSIRPHITQFTITLHAASILHVHALPTVNVTVEALATFAMAHELGHAVGLENNPTGSTNSIMWAPGRTIHSVLSSPTTFDIDSVNMLYN